MTAADNHREPLDEDERELAARLARVGPFDEPSPSLDARILAAAHAAAATRAPGTRRWLAWIGVPPALVTGVGVAAAAVLALGLVWQLQPRTGLLVSGDEAGPTDAGPGEEMFVLVAPGAARRTPAANPPPLPAPPPPPARSAPLTPSAATTAGSGKARLAAPAAAPAASAAAAVTDAAEAAPAQAPQAAVPAATVPAEAAIKEEPGFVATPPRVPSVLARKQSRASPAPTPPFPEPAFPAAPAREAQHADREPDGTTLDRVEGTGVEVTGIRLRHAEVADTDRPWPEVPATDDVRLERDEWLARIRSRRDHGDLDGARASLRLFRHDCPRARIPDDLRTLLGDAGR